jgi:hypothetical protein
LGTFNENLIACNKSTWLLKIFEASKKCRATAIKKSAVFSRVALIFRPSFSLKPFFPSISTLSSRYVISLPFFAPDLAIHSHKVLNRRFNGKHPLDNAIKTKIKLKFYRGNFIKSTFRGNSAAVKGATSKSFG